METVTLAYTEGGSESTRDFDLLSFKGFSDPEDFRIIGVQHRHLDGSISEEIQGFQRVLSLDFGVLQDFEDRLFLLNFIRNSDREVRQSGDFANSILIDYDRFVNEWRDNLEIGRHFFIQLIDNDVRTIFSRGTGYGFDYGTTYGTTL